MRVILAGGGTAGHINPALAIAETVLKKEKNSEILFIGTKKGLESVLVPKKNFNIEYINAEGFKGGLNIGNVIPAVKYGLSYIRSRKLIKDFRPDAVVGTGGYVCAPVVAAANDMKIPTLIHEQNVFPGSAIKILAKRSTVTAVSFAESTRYLNNARQIVLTGNPLREELLKADREKARKELDLNGKKLVVAFGGSLGAKKINEVVCQYIKRNGNREDIRICFATGKRDYENVIAGIDADKYPGADVREYIHNMDTVLAAADVAICRSGAITVSEICALGVASVLVPSPNVTNNHQEYNARALSDKGAAITILEKDFNVTALEEAVEQILSNNEKAGQIREKALSLGQVNATEIIYDKLCKITKRA